MRWFLGRRLFPALLLAVLLALLVAGRALAHANLLSADPPPGAVLSAPPTQVTLTFDEDVDPNFSDIQVLDRSAARVDNADLKLTPGDAKQITITLKPLGDGTYTVAWKVLSNIDGHITQGNYAFTVGSASGSAIVPSTTQPASPSEPDLPTTLARWLHLLSLLALVGAFLFRFLILEDVGTAGVLDKSAGARALRVWRRLALAAFYLALVSGIAGLLLQAATVFSISPLALLGTSAVTKTLFETRFGLLWLARMGLVLALGIAVLIPWGISRFLGLFLGFLALLTVSLGGHSAAAAGLTPLPLLADWLHLAAVALWVGGLFSFFVLVIALWRRLEPPARTRLLGWMIPRFSALAIPATIIIAVTGLYNSLLQVPSLDALIQTLYGETLVLKVALFMVMLGFGGVNLLLLTPRFRRAADQAAHPPRLASHFRLTLALEVLLGTAAILLAGLLTLEPPARGALANMGNMDMTSHPAGLQPVLLADQAAPDVRVSLTIKPTLGNPTEYDVALSNPQSPDRAVENVLRVIVQFTLLDRDLGLTSQIAEPQANGHYLLMGNYLTLPGMWHIRVIVRRAGVQDTTVDFPVYEGELAPGHAPTDPQALQLLEQSESEMNKLTSLHVQQDLNDGTNGAVVTDYDYLAPDAMRFDVRGEGASIAIGPVQYYQDKSGAWTARSRVDPFVFPNFSATGRALGVQLGRPEVLNGENTQVVRYEVVTGSGDTAKFAQWISLADHRLRQLAMVAPAHFMVEYYTAFNSPDISIAAPSGVPTPTPQALDIGGAAGKALYGQYCTVCHGVTGHGDGPEANKLPVQPFDLTTHVLLHDEQYLDAVISNGRGYMPAFKDALSQDQIFAIIAYTRLLAIQAQTGSGAQPNATPRPGFTPQP